MSEDGSICMLCFFCMIVGVLCCYFFRGGGDIEFLWMALLYLSFIAVTFH